MSDTVNLTLQLTRDSDTNFKVGDKQTPLSVLLNVGQVFASEDIIVADGYTAVTLWSTGAGGVSDFQWGLILSNVDLLVQIKNDLGTAEYVVETINANVPFYFGYNTRGGTSSFLTTTVQTTGLGNAVEIKVQRNVADDVGDATVSLYLFR